MTDAEILRQHAKMYEDMYEGDGVENPSITNRLSRLEDTVKRIDQLKWWAMAIIASALGEAAVHIWKH